MTIEFIRRRGTIRSTQQTTDEHHTIKYVATIARSEPNEGDEEFMDIIIDYDTQKYYITLPQDKIILSEGKILREYDGNELSVYIGAARSGTLATLAITTDAEAGTGEFEFIGSE